MDLLEPIAAELPKVEQALARQVQGFDARLGNYVEYVLGSSGKRLRPSLALLAGGATGQITDKHITLAVIVELVHVATLIHDDILDEAALRHRLPTSNARWGNELSVLLGDCLFAHALRLAAGYSTTEVCRRISEATNTVCSGEILQSRRCFSADLTLDQYLNIINMKTGALFAVSCELGARLNEPAAGCVQDLQEFGANLGVAYQIYDDCLDIFGQEFRAGKSLGTDVKKGKLTLPFLLLLKHANSRQREELSDLMFHNSHAEQQKLRNLVRRNGVISESLATIDAYIARAQNSLEAVPPTMYCAALRGLTQYISEQSRALLTEPSSA